MNLSKEKMWRSAERALKRTKGYQRNREFGEEENYELMYVLAKGKYPLAKDVIAVAGYEDVAIQFHPIADSREIDLWGFNFERDLLVVENMRKGCRNILDTVSGTVLQRSNWKKGRVFRHGCDGCL